MVVGGVIALLALVWFWLATFVIVPAHAVEVYGVAESGYFQRYGALGNTPADIFKSFFTQPDVVWSIASEPARVRYLLGLLAPFGFLALLAPEIIVLSLPVLLANLLSAYPAQYYGEFHYSAPPAPYFVVAAVFGLARLWRWLARRSSAGSGSFQQLPASGTGAMIAATFVANSRTALRPLLAAALVAWVLFWGGRAYVQHGRGPGGARYDPTPITAHHRGLARFVTRIPRAASVTATAAVHPHLSHRRRIYQFPIGLEGGDGQLGDAEWALLDVTTNTDMAPGDLKWRVETMLTGDWAVVDAADGFLLLSKTAVGTKEIPDAFYDFARVPGVHPPVADTALGFVDLAVDDWPRWRRPSWSVSGRLASTSIRPSMHRCWRYARPTPILATVWRTWRRRRCSGIRRSGGQPGERVRITTPSLSLPSRWGVVTTPAIEMPATWPRTVDDTRVLVGSFQRVARDRLLRESPEAWLTDLDDRQLRRAVRAQVGDADLAVSAWLPAQTSWPGDSIDVRLQWSSGSGDWPAGVELFVHLRDTAANLAQSDGLPRYFVRYAPTEALRQHNAVADWRQLVVAVELPSATVWDVYVGLYRPDSSVRLELFDERGNLLDDELHVGALTVGPSPTPDQACALIAATCAALPRRPQP